MIGFIYPSSVNYCGAIRCIDLQRYGVAHDAKSGRAGLLIERVRNVKTINEYPEFLFSIRALGILRRDQNDTGSILEQLARTSSHADSFRKRWQPKGR